MNHEDREALQRADRERRRCQTPRRPMKPSQVVHMHVCEAGKSLKAIHETWVDDLDVVAHRVILSNLYSARRHLDRALLCAREARQAKSLRLFLPEKKAKEILQQIERDAYQETAQNKKKGAKNDPKKATRRP